MPADPLGSLPKTKAAFIEPMECLSVSKLPEGSQWVWEIKLDGYRAVAVKSGTVLTLYSRNRKIVNKRFPSIQPLEWNGKPFATSAFDYRAPLREDQCAALSSSER